MTLHLHISKRKEFSFKMSSDKLLYDLFFVDTLNYRQILQSIDNLLIH